MGLGPPGPLRSSVLRRPQARPYRAARSGWTGGGLISAVVGCSARHVLATSASMLHTCAQGLYLYPTLRLTTRSLTGGKTHHPEHLTCTPRTLQPLSRPAVGRAPAATGAFPKARSISWIKSSEKDCRGLRATTTSLPPLRDLRATGAPTFPLPARDWRVRGGVRRGGGAGRRGAAARGAAAALWLRAKSAPRRRRGGAAAWRAAGRARCSGPWRPRRWRWTPRGARQAAGTR